MKKNDGYKVGQVWRYSGDNYLVARISSHRVNLICLDNNSNRWTDSVRVNADLFGYITEKNWKKLTGSKFEKFTYLGMFESVYKIKRKKK